MSPPTPDRAAPVRFDAAGLSTPVTLYDAQGNPVLVVTKAGETTIGVAGNPVVIVSRVSPAVPALYLGASGGALGFFGATPVTRQSASPASLPNVVQALRNYGLLV